MYWTAADRAHVTAQASLPPENRASLQEPWLEGLWDTMPIDPRVWGFQDGNTVTSLLTMTVQAARHRLIHLRNLDLPDRCKVLGYAEEHAIWPVIWSRSDPISPPEEIPTGIQGLEAHWLNQAVLIDNPVVVDSVNRPPLWLDLGRQRSSRPSREDRASQRGTIPSLPLRPGFSQVWRRLADPTIQRPLRIIAQDILHGTLGCGAYLRHTQFSP